MLTMACRMDSVQAAGVTQPTQFDHTQVERVPQAVDGPLLYILTMFSSSDN